MIEAGELGEIRHFAPLSAGLGRRRVIDTWRFNPDEAGSGALAT